MHSTSFAPLLSATFMRVSCWIMETSPRPLDDFDEAPALLLRQRPGLHDAHPVADVEGVLLVVDVEPGRALDGLVVPGMALAVGDRHDGGLVHAVGHDHALAHLASVAVGGLVGHQAPSSSRASAAAIS